MIYIGQERRSACW